MLALSTAAKLTHSKYGNNSQPAILLNLPNQCMVNTILTQSKAITMNAPNIWCIPKNTIDQEKFKNSCTK